MTSSPIFSDDLVTTTTGCLCCRASRPSEDRRTRLVLIGRNLNVAAMRALLTPKARPLRSLLRRATATLVAGALGAALAVSAGTAGPEAATERPAPPGRNP